MKFILTFLLMMASIASLSAGARAEKSEEAGPVELRFTVWSGNQQHLDTLNGIAANYSKTHPSVSVKFDVVPFGEYVTKLTLQLAGSNPPDCGWLLESSAPTFIGSGVLTELGSYMRTVKDYDFPDLAAAAMKLWQTDKGSYAIPFSTSPFIFFYNQDIFKAAGVASPLDEHRAGRWTWENFARSARAIKEKTGKFAFQTFESEGYTTRIWHTIVPILRAYGAEVWDAANTATLDRPEAVQAMRLYHGMIFTDKTVTPPGDQTDFYTGEAAATIGQISRVAKLKDAKFKWDIAPMPAGPAGAPRIIGQAAIGAFKASRHNAAAIDFIAFMTNKENTLKLAAFFPPIRASVLSAEAFKSANPLLSAAHMDIVKDGIANGTVLPAHVNFPRIDLMAKGEFDKLWVPNPDLPKVLAEISAAFQPLLKAK